MSCVCLFLFNQIERTIARLDKEEAEADACAEVIEEIADIEDFLTATENDVVAAPPPVQDAGKTGSSRIEETEWSDYVDEEEDDDGDAGAVEHAVNLAFEKAAATFSWSDDDADEGDDDEFPGLKKRKV